MGWETWASIAILLDFSCNHIKQICKFFVGIYTSLIAFTEKGEEI